MSLIKTKNETPKEALIDTEKEAFSHQLNNNVQEPKPWKFYQKFLFRTAFVFFLFMSVPTNVGWYIHLFNLDWSSLHYRDLYDLARFSSGFRWAGNTILGNNLLGYANWVITLLIATGIATVWSALVAAFKKEPKEYNILYYWLRVIVRYRAGIGIIGFGFTKLLPVQMPYPSEAILNTNFGDFTAQKIFWLSIGIVPWYQVFTGVVELAAGTLLFFRRTEALGAALLISALGTITYVNFAYDGGVHVYASYFTLYGLFILAYYIPRLYRLLILEKVTVPVDYFPDLSAPWQKIVRYSLKTIVIGIFLVWLFYLQLINFLYDPYKQPAIAGIPELRGSYEVVDFRLDGEYVPPYPKNPDRWNEVAFEKWSTLSLQVNQAHILDLSNGGGSPMRDINRTFEIAGVAGGRKAFYYEADTINKVLYLQNKNISQLRRGNRQQANRSLQEPASQQGNAQANQEEDKRLANAALYPEDWIPEPVKKIMRDETYKIHPLALSARRKKEIAEEIDRDPPREKMILSYEISENGDQVRLTGTNEQQQEVEITLKKTKKEYLLTRSTLDAGKYD